MEPLANAFSVLDLDAEDDDQAREAAAAAAEASNASEPKHGASSSGMKDDKASNHDSEAKEEKSKHNIPSTEYKMPLVWIDLEMTGLNVEVDRILEIACIITDGNLNKQVEGPDLVIHQTKECLDRMGEWCQSHHAASGLTKKVIHSTISEREAENQIKGKPQLKKVNTEQWMISGKASWNSNTSKRIYLKLQSQKGDGEMDVGLSVNFQCGGLIFHGTST
ncbi:oligoribonuclease-like isoform X2 [Cannabis sativa]|uniref:oligoribonuclease isoform X2 n=1 Tax=Cannabis sativa TaxID=3483 RepID=UPI0029CA6196|nr:oligoribonuclease isoform X2 [Cannabis sativa]XP_060963477.1 oligoribonuclease-like isoform X2 [Cannabis sativa]